MNQLKIEQLEILETLLSMKKMKMIINHWELAIFGVIINIEYECNRDRNVSAEVCLHQIRPYSQNLRKSDMWKIQLLIAINFNTSQDNVEEHVILQKVII